MDLVTFDRDLRAVAGTGAVRPFLCNGSPFGCPVFLVGINPATDIPLWPYWSVERGCDKQGWLRAYLERKGRLGPTRAKIERLFDALAPTRALECNIFQHHSPREADLDGEHRTTEVFDFLLERLAPRIVFVHGGSAITHLQRLTGTRIAHGTFTPVRYQEVTFEVFAGHHLVSSAGGWSYTKIDQLGRELRARCLTPAVKPAEPGAAPDQIH